jgi:uncharacterized protein YecE (DUF72 family)
MYYSAYELAYLRGVAQEVMTVPQGPRWCIFDNTARGAAVINALEMSEMTRLSS